MRSTLIMLVVGLALGAYIWLVEIRGAAQQEEVELAERRFLAIDAGDVAGLSLPLEGATGARLERAGDVWRLLAPVESLADADVVREIVSGLAELEAESVFEAGEGLELFGLGEDAVRVEIALAEGAPLVLRLGADSPVGGRSYVQLEGDWGRVFTVARHRMQLLKPELLRLRDKRLFTLDPGALDAFRVMEGGELVVQAELLGEGEAEEGGWQLVSPENEPADARRVVRFLQDLSLARASGFIDTPEALKSYGLEPGEVEVEWSAGERSERLRIGRADYQIYAVGARGAPVWEVSSPVLERVPRRFFDFRQKVVFALEGREIERLELDFPQDATSYRLVRGDEGWREIYDSLEVDSQRVEDLVYLLAEIEAIGLIPELDREKIVLSTPRVRVVAFDSAGSELGWLELGDPPLGEGMFAQSSQNQVIWRVASEIAGDVPVGEEAFRNHWLAGGAESAEFLEE